MKAPRLRLKRLARTALILLAVHAAPAHATERLTRAEGRAYALDLIKQNQPAAARAVALGLLQADSRDVIALITLANAEHALGNAQKAKFAARRAYYSADEEKQRFAAAFLMASLLRDEKKYNQAQIWIRRAGQTTNDANLEETARKAYAHLRAENPWSLHFGFTLAPSSNVNGGPNDNTYTVGDLTFVNPSAVPLSGLEIGAGFTVMRRFKPQPWGQAHASLRYDTRQYVLSDSAKAAVPTARGSDYSYSALEFTLGATLPNPSGQSQNDLAVSFGYHRQGGAALARSARLRVGHSRAGNAPVLRYGYGATLEHLDRLDISSRSTTALTLDAFALRQLGTAGLLRYGVSLSKTQSAHTDMAHAAASGEVSYMPLRPLLTAQTQFSASLKLREYDHIRYGTTKRRDQKLSLSASFLFTEAEYYGFAPSVTLRATRNLSNKSFFDTQDFGISFGIKSTF